VAKHTVLGIAKQVSEALFDEINTVRESDINSPASPPKKKSGRTKPCMKNCFQEN